MATKPIQLEYAHDPWKVLVVCAMCNRTAGRVARPYIRELFRRWPSAADMAGADRREITAVIGSLGFGNQRAQALILMSAGYVRFAARNLDPRTLYGCGKYAGDAWDIFVRGERPEGVTDRVLLRYLRETGEEDNDGIKSDD